MENLQQTKAQRKAVGVIEFIVGAIIILFLLSSCNVYKQLEKTEPKSVKDSSRLAVRYKITFPPANDKKSDTVIIEKKSDNAAIIKHISDSIEAIAKNKKAEIQIKYKDTCISAQSAYAEAMEIGYQQGYYKGKLAAGIDTLEITKAITHTITDNSQITIERNLRIDAQEKLTKETKKKERNWHYLLAALSALTIVGVTLYFSIRKSGKLLGATRN